MKAVACCLHIPMSVKWVRYAMVATVFLSGASLVVYFNLSSEESFNSGFLSRTLKGKPEEEKARCKIPLLNPWDEAVKAFVKRPKAFSCPKPPPLTTLHPDGQPTIVIEPSLIGSYGKEKDGQLKCCVSAVTRGKVKSEKDKRADQSYAIQKCQPFNVSVSMSSDFALVECKRGNKTVYTDIHATIVPTETSKNKIATASRPFQPSILLLGLDSSSRLNIHRSAPMLVQTLMDIGAVEFTSYNKVGDNTLPNLLPILTGVSLPDAERSNSSLESHGVGCWPNNKYTFDGCPFIWRNFSDKGYVTMFGEDEPSISMFNYNKPGFRNQPTDHYLRPFFIVAEKRLRRTKRQHTWCYANKGTLSRLLSYNRSFVKAYKGKAPFFSLLFITGVTHQNAADVELADRELSQFIRNIVNETDTEEGGLFLAVFSDHGMRWGSLRQSPFGWLEERLPFLFIRPPLQDPQRSLEELYPNLLQNRNSLTSPFDFHFTLHALLHGRGSHPVWSSCTKCFDLLHDVIPLERTCVDAAIPDKWCACSEEIESSASENNASMAALTAVEYLNSALSGFSQCSRLTMRSVISGRNRVLPAGKKEKKLELLVVTFTTIPGDAMFEATMQVRSNGTYRVSSELSRLNQYGNQSWCVDDPEKKLYCFCL